MKKHTRLLAAWLCTLLVIPTVVSCADPKTPTQPENKDTTPVNETATLETANPTENALQNALAKLDGKDFGGYEFRILDRDFELDPNWGTVDVYAEAENGDTINDAVYKRNRLLEEKLNIRVVEKSAKTPYDTAKTAILANCDDFDVVTDGLSYLSTVSLMGGWIDLNTVSSLKLNEPWWDQDMSKDLSIMNKVFFCTGDISIMDNYGTWCVMFNKDLIENYDLDNIYDHVKAGTWTMPLMHQMAKAVTKDLDGNGVLDDTDQWGYLTESYNEYGLWAAGGQHIIKKDADDLPVLDAYTNRSVDVINFVTQFTQDKSCTLIADKVKDGCAFTNEHFGAGKALFIYGGMWLITKYRAYDVNFGVVPAPKYDESQTRYYNTYSHSNCTAYSIPIPAHDIDRTGTILEAMAEISKYTLTPAYYDIALKGKYIRDEESAEMLDIILSQRAYDLGMIFNWGNLFSTITGLSTASKADFASAYAKREKAAQKDIDKFIAQLEALES